MSNKKKRTVSNGDIVLHEDTQAELRELMRRLNESKIAMELIVRSYVKALGKTGNYKLSSDFTKLEIVKE